MALTEDEQALFDHARFSLPAWLTGSIASAREWLYAFTQVFSRVRAQGQEWLDVTYLENATGAALNQHAIDRGTTRRAGESDPTLRERLRSIQDSVTEPALLTGIDAILEANSQRRRLNVGRYTGSGWNLILEVKLDQIAPLTFQTIDDGSAVPYFTYTPGALVLHFDSGVTTRQQVQDAIVLDSVAASLVDILSSSGSPSAVLVGSDQFGPVRFQAAYMVTLRRDRAHMHTVLSCRSFMSRGYRMTGIGRLMTYVVILPYGTTSVTAKAVSEYLRQNGPGGFLYIVERRLNP